MERTNKQVIGALAAVVAALFTGGAEAAIPAVNATFYISGASAARAIPPAIATEICDPGVADWAVYGNNAVLAQSSHRIDVCTVINAAPAPVSIRGLKVAFYSRASGGSLFGVRPIGVPQAIKFLNGAACPNDDGINGPAGFQLCTTLTSDADFAIPDGANDGHVPDFGLSDEEPVFNCEVAKENGPVQCTAAELAGLKSVKVTAAPTYQLAWTIQAGTDLATELGGNISSTVLTGIFSGLYQSVEDIKLAMGIAPLAGDDTEGLKVCRRTNTSGTQSGHAHLWVGSTYCGSSTKIASFIDAATAASQAGTGTIPANWIVVENDSSATVESCVATTVADRGRSIGINSLENSPLTGAVNLSIDGVAPSLETAGKGLYKWYAESTLNSNTDTVNNAAALNDFINADLTARATNTQRSAFLSYFRTTVRDPLKVVAAGLNGINASPNLANPTIPYNPATPVGWTTKNVGAGGSNCKGPLPVFP